MILAQEDSKLYRQVNCLCKDDALRGVCHVSFWKVLRDYYRAKRVL